MRLRISMAAVLVLTAGPTLGCRELCQRGPRLENDVRDYARHQQELAEELPKDVAAYLHEELAERPMMLRQDVITYVRRQLTELPPALAADLKNFWESNLVLIDKLRGDVRDYARHQQAIAEELPPQLRGYLAAEVRRADDLAADGRDYLRHQREVMAEIPGEVRAYAHNELAERPARLQADVREYARFQGRNAEAVVLDIDAFFAAEAQRPGRLRNDIKDYWRFQREQIDATGKNIDRIMHCDQRKK